MSEDFERARAQFLQGTALLEQGHAAQAAACLEASLQHLPGRPSTLLNLGLARLALEQPAAALAAFDAALAAAPGDVQAWCHRGAACSRLGRVDDALVAYERALALDGRCEPALFHRAAGLAGLGRHDEALQSLEPLLQTNDRRAAPAWQLVGQSQQVTGRLDEALTAYERAAALDPTLPRIWTQCGQLQQALGRTVDAAAAYERSIALGHEPEAAAYLLAALRDGAGAPTAAPVAYVRGLFDPYAADFDRHLVQALHYRGHEAVVSAAQAVFPGRRFGSVLDLGCGTGLCGEALRGQVDRLEGVDLSPAMLEQARRRGVYTALYESELALHLEQTDQRPTLVLAADVFIYVGALERIFAGVGRVLQAGGAFVFTVESVETAPTGFVLRRSGRYAHTAAYLNKLAAQHGLVIAGTAPLVLREEQHEPIAGLVLTLLPGVPTT